MVHALQKVRHHLHRGGLLINVHNLPTPSVIELHSSEKVTKIGWILDRDDFLSERSAFNALAQVVAEKDFNLEDEQDFLYNIYVDDLPELQEWLGEWWASAYLSDGIIQRIEGLTQEDDRPTRIVLSLIARMTKLKAF